MEEIKTNPPTMAALAPIVMDSGEPERFIQVHHRGGPVVATFPYSGNPAQTRKRAEIMAVRFVESLCWYVPDSAEAISRQDALRRQG